MNTHSATSFGGKDVPRLSSQMEELEGLLRRQIELVRKSDYRSVEALAQRANSIIEEITIAKGTPKRDSSHLGNPEAFEQDKFNANRERLAKLYRELTLMIAAHKDELGKQLRRVRSGRKTIKAYRGKGG